LRFFYRLRQKIVWKPNLKPANANYGKQILFEAINRKTSARSILLQQLFKTAAQIGYFTYFTGSAVYTETAQSLIALRRFCILKLKALIVLFINYAL